MKKKSILLGATAVMLVAATSIGGMLAYFTDDASKTNTFNIGDVEVVLNESGEIPEKYAGEADWHAGVADVEGKSDLYYEDVMPGSKYAKVVTVNLAEDSQDAWVFAEIVLDDYDKIAAVATAAGIDTTALDNALLVGDNLDNTELVAWKKDGTAYSLVYSLGTKSAEDAAVTLFEGVQIPGDVTSKMITDANLSEFSVTVKAYAIQAANVDKSTAISELFTDSNGYTAF